jgi:glutathione S-transferase
LREYLSELDLDVMVRPCPKGGALREEVQRLGGKQQFPFLVDPNTGRSMYESRDIIRYLADEYGDGRVPLAVPALGIAGSGMLSSLRARGVRARAAKQPAQPLELYSFEASPYCRIVRERLCELGLPYHLINVAKKSAQRDAFVARSGKMMVPYLVDPNTQTAMFESAEIVDYLERTYATSVTA